MTHMNAIKEELDKPDTPNGTSKTHRIQTESSSKRRHNLIQTQSLKDLPKLTNGKASNSAIKMMKPIAQTQFQLDTMLPGIPSTNVRSGNTSTKAGSKAITPKMQSKSHFNLDQFKS